MMLCLCKVSSFSTAMRISVEFFQDHFYLEVRELLELYNIPTKSLFPHVLAAKQQSESSSAQDKTAVLWHHQGESPMLFLHSFCFRNGQGSLASSCNPFLWDNAFCFRLLNFIRIYVYCLAVQTSQAGLKEHLMLVKLTQNNLLTEGDSAATLFVVELT